MKIIKETLDNGLTVIMAPMVGIETATGMFSVRAGSHYETTENQGISHFLEHMAFKGTEKRPNALDIAKEVEGRGGNWNAFTGNEKTGYFIKISSDCIKIVLDILSDMVFYSKFDSRAIEKEKGTIIEEIKRRDDDPESLVVSYLWPRLLYGDQPAGREIAGTEESVKGMERKHFLEFTNALYTSENSVFCLVGYIPRPFLAYNLIDKYFGNMTAGKPKIKKPFIIESQSEPALMVESRDTAQSHLVLGVRAYGYRHPKIAALDVMNTILGGNMSSRLWNEIREKRGLAYRINTFFYDYSDTGNFAAWAGIKKENIFEAVKIILDEFKKICIERVFGEELERAKKYIIGTSRMSFESSVFVSRWLSSLWIRNEKIESFLKKIKKIQAVTAEDIQTVAREIFVNKGLNLAIIGPHQGMEEEFLKILKF